MEICMAHPRLAVVDAKPACRRGWRGCESLLDLQVMGATGRDSAFIIMLSLLVAEVSQRESGGDRLRFKP